MAAATTTPPSNDKSKEKMSNFQVMDDQLASTIGDSCLNIKIRLHELADSNCFSLSEMAAAEQLVQLSDHSDATSCNTTAAEAKDGKGRGEVEICSSSRSATKVKMEEIFGSFEDDEEQKVEEEEEDNRRWKKFGSLAEIYKKTKPVIQHRREVVLPTSRMSKKVKYC